MRSHEYYLELIPIYALGGLATAERRELDTHLADCAECRKLLGSELAIVKMLPFSIDSVEPSSETKSKLFARIDADLAQTQARTTITAAPARRAVVREEPKRSWFHQPLFAFAAFAAVVFLGIVGWVVLNQPSDEERLIAAIMSDPNVQMVALGGTPDAPNAQAAMYMVPGNSQAVLQVSGLRQLPADKGYEFWFFKDGKPQPSTVFTVKPDGTNIVIVEANDTVENFKGWGVTIEPRQGVAQPTGTLVILGGL